MADEPEDTHDPANGLARRTKPAAPQLSMFETEVPWREYWWGMPKFEQGDATPSHRVTINFMTAEDVREFAKVTGLKITPRSDSAWFPPEDVDKPSDWAYE